jgi:hypothetical protein|tara:strand:+ start:2392 stop:2508 length:117 start_codon:yes stop_codon:yes gene_type:complete
MIKKNKKTKKPDLFPLAQLVEGKGNLRLTLSHLRMPLI